MIDIIIVTHGEYGKAMLASSELIMGVQENVQAFGFYLGESVEQLKELILQAISHTRKGSEILILTDMRSGSPFNVTASLMKDYVFEHLTGINLPILLEILCSRTQMDVKTMIAHVMSEEMKTLIHVNEMLKEDVT